MRVIDDLKPASRRVRRSERSHVVRVRKSIETQGYVDPVLITVDGEVIDGHIRVEAARLAGLTEITCIVVDHLSDQEIRALRITLNRLQEKGAWDLDELKLEFQDLMAIDFPLELTGFEVPEIDLVLAGDDDLTPCDEIDAKANAIPDLEADELAISKLGDIWQLGPHQILCGDARDQDAYTQLLSGVGAQAVITDPPFNVPIKGHAGGKGKIQHSEFVMASGEMSSEEFTVFLTDSLRLSASALMDGGLLYSFIDWRHLREILAAIDALGLTLINLVVWAKSNGGMGSFYRSRHELIFVLKKGSAPHRNNVELGRHGRNRTNVWEYPGVNSLDPKRRADLELHPTVKPAEMIADAILDCTAQGDIVLDPFLGSGTTLIAAEKTGRSCYAMELDPRYVDVAVRRWQAFTGSQAHHAETGLSFAKMTELRRSPVPLLPPPTPAGTDVAEAGDE
jgi:DNA modification methylase